MKTYKLIITSLFLLKISFAFSQLGSLKGVVIDENGINLQGIKVEIEELSQKTYSDQNGAFYFLNVPIGNYLVSYSISEDVILQENVTISNNKVKSLTIVLNTKIITLDEVVIWNHQKKYVQNIQQNAIRLTNVLPLDQIGIYPDVNIADVVKRVSGINIQINEGEAQNVIVRGLAPELNSITLNGIRMSSTNGNNRQIELDVIPSDMIQSVEVNKTLTPDQEADALGGSVNLTTRTTPKGFRLSSTLGTGLNTVSDKRVLHGTFLAGNRSKNNKLGWMLSAHLNDNRLETHRLEAIWANKLEFNTGNLDDDGEPILDNVETNPFTVNLVQELINIERIRRSIALNFDYEFNASHNLFFNAMYNERDDRETRFIFEYEVLSGDYIMEDDFELNGNTLEQFPAEVARQTVAGHNDNNRLEKKRLQSYSIGGLHFFNQLKLDWLANYGDGREETNERVIEFKSEYDVLNETNSTRVPFLTAFNPDNATDFKAFEYEELVEEDNTTKEKNVTLYLNTEVPVNFFNQKEGTVKFGFRNRFTTKDRNNTFNSFDRSDDFPNLSTVPLRDYSIKNFEVGSQYQIGVLPNHDWLGELTLNNPEPIPSEFSRQNYALRESVNAGYLMSEQKISKKFSALAGFRVEHTFVQSETIQTLDENSTETLAMEEQEYTNILPGVHLKYRLDKTVQFQFSWTNTLARPNYEDLIPTLNVSFSDEEIFIGNPDLNPTTSMNFDASFQYNKNNQSIAISAFFKELNNFIYTFRSVVPDEQFGAGTDGFSLFQPLNGDGATIFGVELEFYKKFTFLQGLLKNFSLSGNYSYVTSATRGVQSITGEIREDIDLPNTAPHTFNLAISYDDKKLNSRIAVNYSGNYLSTIGNNRFEDLFYGEQFFLDFSLNYKLLKSLSLYTTVTNITNQPLRFYQGERFRTAFEEYYGRRITFGLKYDFFKPRIGN